MHSSTSTQGIDRSFCVAPMMKCTDRYFRQFARSLSRQAVLYTEMIGGQAAIYGAGRGILDFSPVEQPLALQIGSRDPAEMARCGELASQWGYAEFNINAGCPSQCASAGGFGATLMQEPEHLATCIRSVRQTTDLPISVKCRIGVRSSTQTDAPSQGSRIFTNLARFVETTHAAGCSIFIVHAREAILGKRFSPKQNRQIPKLDYEVVYRLKEAFPDCEIILNGGIQNLAQALEVRGNLDGVMLGRAIYSDPLMLRDVDALFYDASEPVRLDAQALTERVTDYVQTQLGRTVDRVPVGIVLKHLLNLFRGQPHAREWRSWISEQAQARSRGGVRHGEGCEPLIEQLEAKCLQMASGTPIN